MTWALAAAGGLAAIALSLRYAWWRPRVSYRHPRILMYHMVREPVPGARFNKLRVSPERFARQLRWLKARGWHFALLSDLLGDVPEKTVVITFDDGYRDNLTAAHPLLLEHGARATLFLVTDREDRDWSAARKAHHDEGELRREPKLGDAEVAELLESGIWELGAHTVTHAPLTSLDRDAKRREIAGSRGDIAGRFDAPVRGLAYPFGIFEDEDVALAREAGFDLAVTTEPGISRDVAAEALRLKRVKVSGGDGALAFALRMRTGMRGLKG